MKYCLLCYYRLGYDYKEEDIRLISVMLGEFIDKKLKRVKKMTREDWVEFVYFALDSLWAAALGTDVLMRMSDEASKEVDDVFQQIPSCRATNDMKELMSDISKGMKRDYALEVLRCLNGKTGGGNARRAYRKALKHFNITEAEL